MDIKIIDNLKSEFEKIKLCHKHLDRQRKLKLAYEAELVKLNAKLESELKDIKVLEKIGIRALFFRTLGEYSDKIEIEKQEYLQAVLNYNKCIDSISLINFEIEILEEKLKDETEIKSKLVKALKKLGKENSILDSASVLRLEKISEKIEYERNAKIELEEALIMGHKSFSILSQIERKLVKVENWGYNNSNINNGHIDDIQAFCYQAEIFLVNFEEELRDTLAYLLNEVEDSTNRKLGFNSIFIEKLIIDWVFEKKIENALNFIFSLESRLKNVLFSLENELSQIKISLELLESNRLTILNKI